MGMSVHMSLCVNVCLYKCGHEFEFGVSDSMSVSAC